MRPRTNQSAVPIAPARTSRQLIARVGQVAEHHGEQQRDDDEAAERGHDLEHDGRDAELRRERVADRGDHRAERQRDEQQEGDGDEDAEREHALHEEDADLIALGIGLHSPRLVQCVLQAGEEAGRAEDEDDERDHRGDGRGLLGAARVADDRRHLGGARGADQVPDLAR